MEQPAVQAVAVMVDMEFLHLIELAVAEPLIKVTLEAMAA
jgi:hypothetical protein